MSKKNKLARGGAVVRPLLANGERPEYTVFYDMQTQVLVLDCLEKLKSPETNKLEELIKLLRDEKRKPTKEEMVIAATGLAAKGTPTFTEFIARLQDNGLEPLDAMASVMAASIGTERELTVEEIQSCLICPLDNEKLAIALHQAMPNADRVDGEGWEQINKAENVEELNAAFFAATSQK